MTSKITDIFLSVISLFLSMSCTAQLESKSIALGKSYWFSVAPNYSLTAGNDEIDLTDGKKKNGKGFWQDKSTVGWSNKTEIQINLDLGDVYYIDSFLINTARNSKAEVEFPSSCLVFTSVDNKQFEYRGDLMLSAKNPPGSYQVESFKLNEGQSLGRYVKFVVATKSKFVFLDEIEVYGEKSKGKTVTSLRTSLTNRVVEQSDMDSFIKKTLDQSVEKHSFYMALQSTKDFLGDLSSGGDMSSIKDRDVSSIEAKLTGEKIKIQSQILSKGVVFTPISDIRGLNSFSLKDVISYQKKQNTSAFNIDDPSFRYFSLINNESRDQVVVFQDALSGEVSEVLPVSNLNYRNINDALRSIPKKGVVLKAGENKNFVVNAKLRQGNITISTANNSAIATIPLHNEVNKAIEKLNANAWAYLDKPIIQDNKEVVISDLERAGINVIVVHSAFIDGNDTKDFSELKNYVSQFKNLKEKKILLFYNLKGNNAVKRFNGQKFLDQNWKNNFTRWYKLMQSELSKIGVNTEEVYFYPYDEIKADEVHDFVELVKWGKSTLPNFKTFVTIIDEKTFEAGNYSDIVQLSQFLITKAKNINNNQIWMYSVLDHSRERDPYKDYRLMSWYAYYYDLKGVGFWNYSALPTNNDGKYNRAINGNIDYSALYLDEDGTVLTSLRWLYFQQGIKDYSKLKSKEKIIGKEKLKKLVKEVIDNSDDARRADFVLKSL